jgi:hypothetical protein
VKSQAADLALKWPGGIPILGAIRTVRTLVAIAGILLVTAGPTWANGGENFPFHVGEKLTYQIYWGPLVVGRASLEVQGIEKVDGHDCYHLVAQAKTAGLINLLYPVDSKTESWLDVEGLFSRKFRQDRSEGKSRRHDETSYDYARNEAVVTNLTSRQARRFPLDRPVQDVISSLYYMRAQVLKLDDKKTFVITTGDTNTTISIRPDQRKLIWVRPTGDVPALRVEPNPTLKVVASNKGRLWFWVSDDHRRLPLILATDMTIGNAKLVLYKMEASNPAAMKQLGSTASGDTDDFAANPSRQAANN